MHFWDSFYCNRNFFRNKNQQRRDARRDHESFGKQPLGKPGDYTGYNLQDIPGVEITDNSLAGRKQIRIRGEASSRVLILIDGQEVTYQRAGDNYGVGLLIDESALERVEVVKGPYSVLYGSQAIGGIVNFITKKGESPDSLYHLN